MPGKHWAHQSHTKSPGKTGTTKRAMIESGLMPFVLQQALKPLEKMRLQAFRCLYRIIMPCEYPLIFDGCSCFDFMPCPPLSPVFSAWFLACFAPALPTFSSDVKVDAEHACVVCETQNGIFNQRFRVLLLNTDYTKICEKRGGWIYKISTVLWIRIWCYVIIYLLDDCQRVLCLCDWASDYNIANTNEASAGIIKPHKKDTHNLIKVTETLYPCKAKAISTAAQAIFNNKP